MLKSMYHNNSVTSRVKKASCENNFDFRDNECARATYMNMNGLLQRYILK